MLLMKEANLMNHQGLHTDLHQMSLLIMSIALKYYLVFFAKEIAIQWNLCIIAKSVQIDVIVKLE